MLDALLSHTVTDWARTRQDIQSRLMRSMDSPQLAWMLAMSWVLDADAPLQERISAAMRWTLFAENQGGEPPTPLIRRLHQESRSILSSPQRYLLSQPQRRWLKQLTDAADSPSEIEKARH